jgi:hypothetical protein
MLSILRNIFSPPRPSGPPETLRHFGAVHRPISPCIVDPADGSWRFEPKEGGPLRLFEVGNLGVDACLLTYRAQLRTQDLAGKAYLQMWCVFDGLGEYFSKGLARKVSGTSGWATYETPFWLKPGQSPSKVKLEIQVDGEGGGTIWVRDVTLLKTPIRR